MSRIIQRWLARLLIAVGATVLMWVAANLLLTMSNRRQYEATLEHMRSSPAAEAPVAPVSLPVGEPIGTLEIARVGLSGVVVEGDDDSVLDRAIGHLPDTPLPWHTGNSALAAHRDALFRPLRDVRPGDVLPTQDPARRLRLRRYDRGAKRAVGTRSHVCVDAHLDQLLSVQLHRQRPEAIHRAS